ncbi:hypothetical protein M0804_010468 [Polistes exclamans]|nr:hypothetical protein M0804_010468 [Polistes exclamans]
MDGIVNCTCTQHRVILAREESSQARQRPLETPAAATPPTTAPATPPTTAPAATAIEREEIRNVVVE